MTNTTDSMSPEFAATTLGTMCLFYLVMLLLFAGGPSGWKRLLRAFRTRSTTDDWGQMVTMVKTFLFAIPVLAVIVLGCGAVIVASWL